MGPFSEKNRKYSDESKPWINRWPHRGVPRPRVKMVEILARTDVGEGMLKRLVKISPRMETRKVSESGEWKEVWGRVGLHSK